MNHLDSRECILPYFWNGTLAGLDRRGLVTATVAGREWGLD
jgi:hypothetical protein